MKPANLVYFGSPNFSAAILESLIKNSPPYEGGDKEGVKVCGVVTSPDKPLGRKQILTPSPVAQLAAEFDLPVYKPVKLDDANLAHLHLLKPDIFLVVSYGKIIPTTWLFTPTIGTFNLHFSLLPKYRGALPISEAIKNQEVETGVTLMIIDAQMDHGPLIAQEKVTIDINDDLATLAQKLTHAGITLLKKHLPAIAIEKFTAIPQNEVTATYTPITKNRTHASAFIGWSVIQKALAGKNVVATHALIRSLNPDPGAWTKINDLEIKLIQTRLTSDNKLQIETVQLPGKSPVSWQNFLVGHKKSLLLS